MSKYITALLILMFAFTANANDAAGNKKNGNRKQQIISAKDQIGRLKGGALLVRMHTRGNSITALRK